MGGLGIEFESENQVMPCLLVEQDSIFNANNNDDTVEFVPKLRVLSIMSLLLGALRTTPVNL